MSEYSSNPRKVKRNRMPKDYLLGVKRYWKYITKGGKLIPEVQMLIYLMEQLGIAELSSDDDILNFSNRFFSIYGSEKTMEDLFNRNCFFTFQHMDYYQTLSHESTIQEKYSHSMIHGKEYVVDFELISKVRGLVIQNNKELELNLSPDNETSKYRSQWYSLRRKRASGFEVYSLFELCVPSVSRLKQSKTRWVDKYSKWVLDEIKYHER